MVGFRSAAKIQHHAGGDDLRERGRRDNIELPGGGHADTRDPLVQGREPGRALVDHRDIQRRHRAQDLDHQERGHRGLHVHRS